MRKRKLVTILRNGTILTQNHRREIFIGDIWIEGNRITKIVRNDANPATNAVDWEDVSNVDCSGKFVLPGFIQSHVHLCQTNLRNCGDDRELLPWLREIVWPGEASHTYDSLYQTARIAIEELYRGGTTTVLTMETVQHTDAAIEAVIDGGIRAILGKALMDRDAGQPAALREDTALALSDADRLYKQWHGAANGRIGVCYAPRFVPTCSEALLRGVAARATERNALVHTHASENRGELELVKQLTGMENLPYLDTVGLLHEHSCIAHCIHLTTDDIALLQNTGTHVLHCPSANLKLASGLAPIHELLTAGVIVGLGADGAACNNNLDGLHEARLMPLLQNIRVGAGKVTAQDALDSLTISGARALGLSDSFGSLEIGKLADVIVVNPNRPHAQGGADPVSRLIYSCRADDVEMVWVDGNQLI